jgi:hypothetical protein
MSRSAGGTCANVRVCAARRGSVSNRPNAAFIALSLAVTHLNRNEIASSRNQIAERADRMTATACPSQRAIDGRANPRPPSGLLRSNAAIKQLHSVLVERHGEAVAFDFMLKLAVALTAPPVKGPTTLRSWCGVRGKLISLPA